MSRPVPNYDPHSPQQPTRTPTRPLEATQPTRPAPDTHHCVYITWRATEPDGRTLDYGRVIACRNWPEAITRTRELERQAHVDGWPTIDAFDVQITGPDRAAERNPSPEGRHLLHTLIARIKKQPSPADPEVF